jgi:hypothetical protein
MKLPEKRSAEWVANEYFAWLPKFQVRVLGVQTDAHFARFYLFTPRLTLLALERSIERSTPDRQLLYIRGGILAAKTARGRLEFREVLNKKYVMSAIHDFVPKLPWFIYRFTQARVHLWVMKRFAHHLKSGRVSQRES